MIDRKQIEIDRQRQRQIDDRYRETKIDKYIQIDHREVEIDKYI